MVEVSVVIPTYNRSEILETCLNKLIVSNFPKTKYEIIVVDDGSTDYTEEAAREFAKEHTQIKYFRQSNKGQGVARNLGISKAKGNIVILIGDDIFVTKNFIEEHYKTHKHYDEENYASLGLTAWDPEIKVTSLMEWMSKGKALFGRFGGTLLAYDQLEGKKFADYNYFYGSNISLKKSLLDKHKFDPWFDGYGWEDIEFGYRLEKKEDLKIIYNPHAIGYHHHEISKEAYKKKVIQIGKSAKSFEDKHPELNKVPRGKKRILFEILGFPLTIFLLKILSKITLNKLRPLYFYALSKKYFLIGLKQKIS